LYFRVTSVPIAGYRDSSLKHSYPSNDLIGMAERTQAEEDRRRSPRFLCGGHAEINFLPSTGILVPGTIRDLSLHGCRVETALPIETGVRAEIVVRVNASTFRAVGEVRAIRGGSGAGVEFVQLSSGGRDMLADLMSDLARLRALMNKLKRARREMNAESFRKELEDGKREAAKLSAEFPFLRMTLPDAEEDSERSEVLAGKERISREKSLVVAVDLIV
jgi:hypothetical protein